jgi:extracellular factor (EF) 3-hydroxypalmitic acid methyl ester biosynthesis protein
MTVFYKSLAPGGVVLATNVAPSTPNRGSLELILDWHLIYRDVKSFETLIPDGVSREQVQLRCDETGVNLFLEVRKSNAV